MNRSKSIFINIVGSTHDSEMVTTLFRFIDEALDQGHRITVWACESMTTLTLNTLKDYKPRDLFKMDCEYPSTAAIVKSVIDKSNGRLKWLICRLCMDDRGTHDQIAEVKIAPVFKFSKYSNEADISLTFSSK